MTSSYPVLIKMATHKLEEQQRLIHTLNMEVKAVRAQQAQLLANMQAGYESASRGVANQAVYAAAGDYMIRARQERENLAVAEQFLLEKVEEEQSKLKALFTEQKRYEKLQETKEKREKAARNKRQQAGLDEVANIVWQKNHSA